MATSIRASLQSVNGFRQDCNIREWFSIPLTRREYRMGQGNLAVVPVRLSRPKGPIFNRVFPESEARSAFLRVFAPETSQRRSRAHMYSGQPAAGMVGAMAECHVLRSRTELHGRPSEPSRTGRTPGRSRPKPFPGRVTDRGGMARRCRGPCLAIPQPRSPTYAASGHLRPAPPHHAPRDPAPVNERPFQRRSALARTFHAS